MAKDVIIIGASGHGKVIADIVLKTGDNLLGFLDDNDNIKDVLGYPVLGNIDTCTDYLNSYFIIGIGNNNIRKKISTRYTDIKYYTAIHPTAVIANDVKLGIGTCVMANAVINTCAKIGEHCIINTAAVVEHDNILENYVHISPGAVLCGTVCVGETTHVGGGAVIKNNINIVADCTIGVGATVTKSIYESGVYVGVPAKRLVK